jgi:hypothetical protein
MFASFLMSEPMFLQQFHPNWKNLKLDDKAAQQFKTVPLPALTAITEHQIKQPSSTKGTE